MSIGHAVVSLPGDGTVAVLAARMILVNETRTCFCYALLFVTCGGLPSTSAAEKGLKQQFLDAYRESAARVEKFYRNVDLTEVPYGEWATRQYGAKATIRWRSRSDNYRDDVVSHQGVVTKSWLQIDGFRYKVVRTRATDAKGKPTYALAHFEPVREPGLFLVEHTQSPRLAFAAFAIFDVPIIHFVQQDFISVTRFEETKDKATVHLSARPPGSSRVITDVLVFDKRESWVLSDWRAGSTKRTVIEYSGSSSGVPLVKRLTYWQEGNFDKPFFVSELKNLVPGPPPADVFSLEAFGLEGMHPRNGGFPWLIVICLAVGALCVVLWLVRSRLQLSVKNG